MKKINRKALTLVEIMVTTLLGTFLIAGIYATYLVGNRAWANYNDSIMLKQEVRNAIIAMTNELREANEIAVIENPGSITLNFTRPAIGMVSYIWSKEGINAHQIIRKFYSDTRILAKHISALNYLPTEKAIVVDVHAAKTPAKGQAIEFHLKEKVALRSQTSMFKSKGKRHERIK